ncbi:serine/threonine-protein kinase [Nonomuraea rhizosphaerae]|uniref:serine/threonine-protein kinase n=1 Tax=Nonomuraea rhizosphaerae TaxID=2665663 RepID=UPI001C603E1A|nr:WD40 repeat domain-containing serine/threonine protein kinase [Nonomuraea rhizosphaerae]
MRQFGDYWLGRQLGAGGQGVVYEAYDERGARSAIKLLRPDHVESPDARERLAKEVAAAGRVAAFCTARVLAADVDGAHPYIVSEYVDGPSLRRAVQERGPYGPIELHNLAIGAATALTAIHMADVVHRDLKPENVVLGPDGPRVIDFGIARVDGATLTDHGPYPIGTPAYMSPERVRGEPAGRAADVWAWGAIVLFAATGRPPFVAGNPTAVYNLVLTRRPDFSSLRGRLRDLVSAAMSEDPAGRPAARELLESLVGGKNETQLLMAAGSRAAQAMRRPDDLTPVLAERPLGEVAEGVYARLSPEDRSIVPGVLLRLVLPGDGADNALRHARTHDLMDGTLPSERVERVLGGFCHEDLLIREGDTLRLASAALVRAWPRLRGWIDADRPGLRLHGMLSEAARLWEAGGRNTADLYRGAALRTTQLWLGGKPSLPVNYLEHTFLSASAIHERRRARRRRQLRAGVAGLTALTLGLVCLLFLLRDSESRQLDVIAARKTMEIADQLRPSDPVKAMLLSVAAWRLAPGEPATVGALYSSLAQRESRVFTPPRRTGDVHYDLSGDGGTLAVLADEVLTLWNVGSGGPVRTVPVKGKANVMALSPDGSRLAVGDDRSVRLWDLWLGRQIGPAFGDGAISLRFAAGGDLLIVGHPSYGSQIWRPADTRVPLLDPRDEDLADIEVSPDGRLFALLSTGGRYELRDARERLSSGRGHAVAFGSGQVLAVSDGEDVRLRHLTKGRQADVWLYRARATSITFSTDGRHVVTYDRTALSLWRSSDGVRLLRHPVQDVTGRPRIGKGAGQIVFRLPDGRVIQLNVWPLTRHEPLVPGAVAGALSSDGRYAAVQGGGVVELRRVSDYRLLRRAKYAGNDVLRFAFDRDGTMLAIGMPYPARVAVWNVPDGRPVRKPFKIPNAYQIGSLAFHPRNGTLAVTPMRNVWRNVELWNPRQGAKLDTLDQEGSDAMAFSPDGRFLVVNGFDNSAIINLTSRKDRPHPFGKGIDGVQGLTFNRDGSRLATGWTTTGVDVWDTTKLHVVRPLPAKDDDDRFTIAAFAPDGQTLAAGGDSGRIWLWNLADGQRLGLPLPAHAGRLLGLAYSPDNRTIVSLGADGVLRSTAIDPKAVAEAVCRRAGGTLSPREWDDFVAGTPVYRPVC